MGPQPSFFDPKIQGLNALLLQAKGGSDAGFCFYPSSGLNMVVYGPAGVGKTILAMQMAVAAAFGEWKVVYFTKDTVPGVLFDRMRSFNFFQDKKPACKTSQHNWRLAVRLDESGSPEERGFIFLNELMENVSGKNRAVAETANQTFMEEWKGKQGLLTLANFTEVPVSTARLDRYAIAKSPYEALGYFQPDLKPVFDMMQEDPSGGTELFVVCDSLSPKTLEYHLKAQRHFAKPQGGA